MIVDIFLPSVIFLLGVVVVFLYLRLEEKVDSLLAGKELRLWHIGLLVAATGIMVTILVFIPEQTLLLFFIFSYVATLFLFTYLFVPKWYLAIAPPIIFVLLFLYYWNLYFFNFFAILLGVSISIYMGKLFTWKTTAAFISLLTILDIIQVLITQFTVTSAKKLLELELPVGIILPTFPFAGGSTFLGLGDIFLVGLIVIQNTRKYNKNFGLASIVSIVIIFFLFQTALLNSDVQDFPATVFVISGWLTSIAAKYLYSLWKREAKPKLN